MTRLSMPCRDNSFPVGQNKQHGTPIRHLLSQVSMRNIGRAFDKGVVREPKKKR